MKMRVMKMRLTFIVLLQLACWLSACLDRDRSKTDESGSIRPSAAEAGHGTAARSPSAAVLDVKADARAQAGPDAGPGAFTAPIPLEQTGSGDTYAKEDIGDVQARKSAGDPDKERHAGTGAAVTAPTTAAASAATATVSAATYAGRAEPRAAETHFRIPVLNYHSVAVDPGNVAVVTPAQLDEHMAYLHRSGYTPLTLKQFAEIWEGRKAPPAKPVLITFDDGYTDNYTEAMPILKKYQFPATLFMTPGWADKEGYLTWEQVKAMQDHGWDIQPHGMSHVKLPTLKAEQQQEEIAEARRLIEERLGTTADVFCYPYGQYNRSTINLLKTSGFRFAFTIEQGMADTRQDPLKLKRLFVNGEENLKAFIAKLEAGK